NRIVMMSGAKVRDGDYTLMWIAADCDSKSANAVSQPFALTVIQFPRSGRRRRNSSKIFTNKVACGELFSLTASAIGTTAKRLPSGARSKSGFPLGFRIGVLDQRFGLPGKKL